MVQPSCALVVALAHELGAYELSDREFPEGAYWWIEDENAVSGDGLRWPERDFQARLGDVFQLHQRPRTS